MKFSRSGFAKLAAAAVAFAALGTASVAQARSNVYFSVGANVAPGVVIGASNYAPAYYPPVYTQPYYVQPAPVYYAPTYYAPPPPIYYRPAPVYFGARFYGGHRHHFRHHGGRHHR
jgi:hypothetical protein